MLIRHNEENLQVRHLVLHHSGDSAICDFAIRVRLMLRLRVAILRFLLYFCRTARTVLLILICISDLKSQPRCDLVANCNCEFLPRDIGICDLKSQRFAIAMTHILRSRMALLASLRMLEVDAVDFLNEVFLTLDNLAPFAEAETS